MAKKSTSPAKPAIRKIVPAASVSDLQDRISRTSREDEIAIPGRLSDWLTPGRKGRPVLDPVLIAAKGGKKKSRKRPADGSNTPAPDIELGADGLPRPTRK